MRKTDYDMPSTIRPRRGVSESTRELNEGWQFKVTLPDGRYKDTYKKWKVEGDCRLWTGTFRQGYPYLTVGDAFINVGAMIVRAKIGGSLPRGKRVIRTCGNKACVNPEHLKLGTQSEAMKIAMSDRDRFGNHYLKKMAQEKEG